MITEAIMAPGAWDLALLQETPKDTRDALDFFGHIVVTPTRVDPRVLSDTNMLALARYAGVVRHIDADKTQLSGLGMNSWLGDDQGRGAVIEAVVSKSAGTFAQWISALLPASVSSGTITDPGGNLTWSTQWTTPRDALIYVCNQFGAEFRVNPDGTFDAGPATSLYTVTPTAIAMKDSGGEADELIDGLYALTLEANTDVDDYVTRTVVLASGSGKNIKTGAANISPATPYKDLFGNAVVSTLMVSSPDTPGTNANTLASQQLALYDAVTRQVVLETDTYDIGRFVVPGDNIYVYDPISSLTDTANQVFYRGRVLNPMSLRVFSYTWPIQGGMGVYFRDKNGAYTDLTDYMVFEQGATSFQVGAPLRPTTPHWRINTVQSIPTRADARQSVAEARSRQAMTLADPTASAGASPAVTWSSSSSPQPSIGNGSLKSFYNQYGSLLFFTIELTIGSSTTLGTGFWSFSLPGGFTAANNVDQAVSAVAAHSGTRYACDAIVSQGGTTVTRLSAAGNTVDPTHPFAWVATDVLVITGLIEIVP